MLTGRMLSWFFFMLFPYMWLVGYGDMVAWHSVIMLLLYISHVLLLLRSDGVLEFAHI